MSASEEALHEQREWLRVTLSSIGDAVITTDTESRVTFLNSVAESLTGWTQAEAAGVPLETVFKIINEESRRTVENPAARALREGVVVGLANQTLLIARDGTEKPIDDSAAPIRNVKGQVTGVVMVFRDITERREMERRLNNALAYADDIIATLREPFLVLDHDLRIRTANRAFYDSFHGTKEETENRLVHELGNGQWNIPKLRTLLDEVLSRNHTVQDFEVEHAFPTLGRKTMLLNARPFPPNSRHPELILLAIEDITERKASERALAEQARLLDLSNDVIIVRDVQNRIIYWNHGAQEIFGWTREEALGQDLHTLLKTEFEFPFEQLIAKLRRESRLIGEVVQTARDGRRITLLCRWSMDYDAQGQPGAILTTATDNTERAQLARQLQEHAEALADLHQRKDEFLAMLSHELRNPLSPLLNAVHILRLQKNEDPLQQQARAVIERQVNQLSYLVNDLLEVSRVITGQIQLRLERLDIRSIVEHAVESARPLIDYRRHELFVSLPAEPVWLQGDSVRLEQAVVNLLNNAAKYTDEGGQIRLSVEPEGAEVVLRVRDTGVGIASELLPRIFDLFTQADRTLDHSQGGLGIGLSLVQKLVELHHGTVAAESAGLGQGSEFIVRLPALQNRESGMRSAEASANPQPTIRNPQLRVLVVDDSVDGAEMVAVMLQMFGHQARTAYSGQSALEIAVEYQPDCVVLDIGLPEIDGYEVARRLRQLPQLKGARLIAATGYGRDSDRQRSQEAGFDYYMVKPIEPEKLQELLTMLTTQERSEE